ncbi:hypothetical protein ACQP6C_06860 [Snodgrassella alvi]|uniref:hypothetical protein n=1 Tax=Snodgrassella alvi TaxID=1196083 RepID=UPI003D06E04D
MINFNLQSYYKNIGGLIFEFAIPPNKKALRSTTRSTTSKYLTEGAFSFIEGIIYEYVPKYGEYGHWGITEVNTEQWLLIKPALLRLKTRVDQAQNLKELKSDLFDFRFVCMLEDDYLKETAHKFSKSKPLLSQMIIDFIAWIDVNIQKCGSFYIMGI